MARNSIWKLKYVVGNPKMFSEITTDKSGPFVRTAAIEAAKRLGGYGWRAWVENERTGERIFENEVEESHRLKV